MTSPIIGVLALQGCVTPHRFHINALGAQYKEVRTPTDLASVHGLILPGGESTAMLKLIHEFGLEQSLIDTFKRVPVWGICAGAILMARHVTMPSQQSFGILNVNIQRNAYGNQLNSFNTTVQNSPVSFIRAPIMNNIGNNVKINAFYNNTPVWVQEGHHMATTFHPELSTHCASNIHKYFIDLVTKTI